MIYPTIHIQSDVRFCAYKMIQLNFCLNELNSVTETIFHQKDLVLPPLVLETRMLPQHKQDIDERQDF